ncbi:MAG: tRNA-binding protein [Deltaproteobacteria bacterium]|nr:tRNA-binding protein [Deltaproteobacteria bacterium]MBW2660120.1 tRNA-binding protein [Deltaproteobacteria bacterium]
METIEWKDFEKIELRVGRIMTVEVFTEARIPAYILEVDFGEDIGIKKSSAQITDLYKPDSLVGKLVVGVINFPPKQIGPHMSECLITGFHNRDGAVALCIPDMDVPPGAKLC